MPYIQGKPRPVLVGYKYMDYYDVGDILSIPGCMTYSDLVTELEIIGFLEEDTSILAPNGTVVHDLDNYIVMPVIYMNWDEYVRMDDEYKHVLSTSIWNTNYMTTLGSTKFYVPFEYENEVLAEIQQALKNYSAASQCYRLADAGQISLKWQSRTEALTSFFAEITAVLMFFSVITVLISIVNRVSRNVKDYAIHIAVGATSNSAVAFILAEMSVILTCSMVFGIFATKWMMHYINMPFYFWRFLGVYALTSVIILVLSAVITLISMRKYDVCTLIK
jgi:ABC-type antimicrobial peptide transport system permease subunit